MFTCKYWCWEVSCLFLCRVLCIWQFFFSGFWESVLYYFSDNFLPFSLGLSEWLNFLDYVNPYQSVSSVTQSCLTLCDPMDCSTPGLPVLHHLPELAQTHVHWFSDAIQPSQSLSSPSPPTFNLSQNQGLFKWVSSSHQVAKVLELQLQHQSF